MTKLILILLVALVFEAIGVVYLSRGMKQISSGAKQMNAAELLRMTAASVTNKNVVLGIFFEALFFSGLLVLLTKGDVSFVWPLTALSFVLTGITARLFLNEQISLTRWAGIFLIMAGAGLITWSEHQKRYYAPSQPPNPAEASNSPH